MTSRSRPCPTRSSSSRARRRRSTSVRASTSYVLVDAESQRVQLPTRGQTRPVHALPAAPTASRCRTWCARAAFALRFGSIDPLISGQVTSNTRVLMERDIRARVEKLAPFMRYDADPVPGGARRQDALGDGRVHRHRHVPVLPVDGRGGRARRPGFNYVRNSVKVDGRRLRGHRHLLRVRRSGPDHPVVAQGVPRSLHRRVADAGGARAAPALPRGPVQGAVEHVRPLPRHGAEAGSTTAAAKWLVSPDPGVVGAERPDHLRRHRGGVDVGRARPTSPRKPRRPGGASIPTTCT